MHWARLLTALVVLAHCRGDPVPPREMQEQQLLAADLQEVKQDEAAELSDIHYQAQLMASYGVNQATRDAKLCSACIKVVGDVMSQVTNNIAKAKTKEASAKTKYSQLKALADAAAVKQSTDMAQTKSAADKAYVAAKQIDVGAVQQIVENDIDSYCGDEATAPKLKEECGFIQPLKGEVSEPIAKGEPVTPLELCRIMSDKNTDVCGKVMANMVNPDDANPDPWGQTTAQGPVAGG